MIGFESIESTLYSSYNSNKLHHAILLHGKKGIGKASFALNFANKITNISSGTNPNIFLISKEEDKKEISVNQIRKIPDFLNQTSANAKDKFIIIDSACELNKSSSNALLKTLEEPHPNNFLILVTHNINLVLPTIKSRCYIIKAPNISYDNFIKILQEKNPRLPELELKFLSEICDNSPALAIQFETELPRFYELFLRSVVNKKLSEELLKKVSDKNFPFLVFEKVFEFFIYRAFKFLQKSQMDFFFEEESVFLNFIRKFSADEIFLIGDECLNMLRKTTQLHLDKKLTLINIFNRITYKQ